MKTLSISQVQKAKVSKKEALKNEMDKGKLAILSFIFVTVVLIELELALIGYFGSWMAE